MNWLKNLYQKYMQGAAANHFPIRSCGVFGGKLKDPRDLTEALDALEHILSPEQKINMREWSEGRFLAATHHNEGRWVRNNWGLWKGSKLSRWFNKKGIKHPDDMSGIIFATYYRNINSLPIKLKEQIQHYIEYWKADAEE